MKEKKSDMITTTDELRDYLAQLNTAAGPPSPGKAEQLLIPLEDAFAAWDEELLGDLLLSVGMMLAVRRGEEGVVALADTLNQMLAILCRREEARRHLN